MREGETIQTEVSQERKHQYSINGYICNLERWYHNLVARDTKRHRCIGQFLTFVYDMLDDLLAT